MAAQNANDLHNQYYLDIYFKGHYTKSAMIYLEKTGMAPKIEPGDMELIKEGYSDFLALNYYASECAKACPEDGKEICFAGVNRSGKKVKCQAMKHSQDSLKCVKSKSRYYRLGLGN